MFVLMFGLLGAVAWLNTPVEFGMREAVANIWMRLPGISRPARFNSHSLFCKFMGASIRSGMNIYDVIYLAAEACNDPRMLDDIDDVLASIEDGVSLGGSISLFKALPEEVVDYIALGEETGRLEDLIIQCADIYEERSKEAFNAMIKVFTFFLRLILISIVLVIGVATGLMGMLSQALEDLG
jgi:MSHA biogenesis protein MshG